ncbi:MAG: phosphoribosylaminoimidazolesuccinocarboxamide synthase [Methanobacteriota archaeon]
MNTHTIIHTQISLKTINKGKVRDIYEVDKNHLLLVATDRISAFDYVLPNPIPTKGICLTQLSKFWFDYTKNIVPNQMISTEIHDFPKPLQKYEQILQYRSMLVKKTQVIPVECIVRGYISGSAWKSYKTDRTVCGIQFPPGLQESAPFPEPLFTPSTKAETGHDINISYEEMKKLVGTDTAEQLKEYSLSIYETAVTYAKKRGIIIADTKFEFGKIDDHIILIDEALTPDSSRFWPVDSYQPGKPQPSFDKQYVRDYLETTGWDKNSTPPQLPQNIIEETTKKYQEAYEKITGKKFSFQ